LQCVAVCCSVLQCVAVCCSVLQKNTKSILCFDEPCCSIGCLASFRQWALLDPFTSHELCISVTNCMRLLLPSLDDGPRLIHSWVTNYIYESRAICLTVDAITWSIHGSKTICMSHGLFIWVTNYLYQSRTVNFHSRRVLASHHTATHCNKPQHTATHCNTLQHTATHRQTLQRSGEFSVNLEFFSLSAGILSHCNTLQHTFIVATHFHCCNASYRLIHPWVVNYMYGSQTVFLNVATSRRWSSPDPVMSHGLHATDGGDWT